MKKLSIFFFAVMALLVSACMDDHDVPGYEYNGASIETNNVVTIQQLKEKYSKVINNSSFTQINEDMQIKGWVTGNDEGGNLYHELSIQDNSGAIIVAINKSALYGEFAIGQQVVIDLNGLYIGAYGGQAEIGGVYTNSKRGTNGIGGMDRFMWMNHYMKVGKPDESIVKSLIEDFDYSKATSEDYIFANQGKLMRLKDAKFSNANGKAVFASKSQAGTQTAINQNFSGISSRTLVCRTSTYAKFANDTLPQGNTNVLGVFTTYRGTWQIICRTRNDAYGIE